MRGVAGSLVAVAALQFDVTLSTQDQRQRSDTEASMVVSWTVVSWISYGVVGLALVVLALLGIEVTLFLLAAAFSY